MFWWFTGLCATASAGTVLGAPGPVNVAGSAGGGSVAGAGARRGGRTQLAEERARARKRAAAPRAALRPLPLPQRLLPSTAEAAALDGEADLRAAVWATPAREEAL